MDIRYSRKKAATLGLLALAILAGGVSPLRAEPKTEVNTLIAGWPAGSRREARAMTEKHGQPNRGDGEAITWLGLYRGKATIVHRLGEPVEQIVAYRVPPEKTADLMAFDGRLAFNQEAGEMSVRTNGTRTNFLILNLAHEIASGFKTVAQAEDEYQKQLKLVDQGKSSRYRDRLLFLAPLPGSAPSKISQ